MITAGILTKAKKLDNYAEDATGGGLWTDTQHYRVTVPAGKRWFLLGGVIYRDVSSTVQCVRFDSSDNIIAMLSSESATTGRTAFPTSAYQIGTLHILDAGDYIESAYGVAQGATAFHSCIILEIGI